MILPTKLAHTLAHMPKLCLVSHVSSSIHLVDPLTLQKAEVDNDKYWRYPFKGLMSSKALTEYTILDSTPAELPMRNGRPVQKFRRERLAEMEVVRDSDFGVNDTKFMVQSHLGMLLKAGDTAMGYDLTTSVFNDLDIQTLTPAEVDNLPDVVLVRKVFPKRLKVCVFDLDFLKPSNYSI